MNDDVKSKLKEKFGALVSDEQLEKVAGGTADETMDIFNALVYIDPQKTAKIINAANNSSTEEMANKTIRDGVEQMLYRDFGITAMANMDDNTTNRYLYKNKLISHDQVIDIINAKVQSMD